MFKSCFCFRLIVKMGNYEKIIPTTYGLPCGFKSAQPRNAINRKMEDECGQH